MNRNKAFTLIEVVIGSSLVLVVFSILMVLFKWGAQSMHLMGKSQFYSGLQYLSWHLRQEVQYGTEVISPVSNGIPTHHLLFYNQDSELEYVFKDKHGVLVIYNFEKEQFKDITKHVKSFRAVRTEHSSVKLDIQFEQKDESFRWQNEISILNQQL
jgi:uncharacterized Rmd1/YagE family protein